VTPEAREHLDKSREYLTKGRATLDVLHYADEAGRAAYLAGFHAAQALISERVGKTPVTHRGVRTLFARLAREQPRLDRSFVDFLADAYDLKRTADYGTGEAAVVSDGEAQRAIETAQRFVECVAALLEEEGK
jgi:uncharacterized protein (UPF0332 family)